MPRRMAEALARQQEASAAGAVVSATESGALKDALSPAELVAAWTGLWRRHTLKITLVAMTFTTLIAVLFPLLSVVVFSPHANAASLHSMHVSLDAGIAAFAR